MTIEEIKNSAYSRLHNDWNTDDAVIFWDGQIVPSKVTTNYIKSGFEFIASPRQSIGSTFLEEVTVAMIGTIYTLHKNKNKTELVQKFLNIYKQGVPGASVDNNMSVSYLSTNTTHEMTRILVFMTFYETVTTVYN